MSHHANIPYVSTFKFLEGQILEVNLSMMQAGDLFLLGVYASNPTLISNFTSDLPNLLQVYGPINSPNGAGGDALWIYVHHATGPGSATQNFLFNNTWGLAFLCRNARFNGNIVESNGGTVTAWTDVDAHSLVLFMGKFSHFSVDSEIGGFSLLGGTAQDTSDASMWWKDPNPAQLTVEEARTAGPFTFVHPTGTGNQMSALVGIREQTAPNAPNITIPALGSQITTKTPTIQWIFSDPDPYGSYQSKYLIQVLNQAYTAVIWDSGWLNGDVRSYTLPAGAIPDYGTWYVRMRVQDETGRQNTANGSNGDASFGNTFFTVLPPQKDGTASFTAQAAASMSPTKLLYGSATAIGRMTASSTPNSIFRGVSTITSRATASIIPVRVREGQQQAAGTASVSANPIYAGGGVLQISGIGTVAFDTSPALIVTGRSQFTAAGNQISSRSATVTVQSTVTGSPDRLLFADVSYNAAALVTLAAFFIRDGVVIWDTAAGVDGIGHYIASGNLSLTAAATSPHLTGSAYGWDTYQPPADMTWLDKPPTAAAWTESQNPPNPWRGQS